MVTAVLLSVAAHQLVLAGESASVVEFSVTDVGSEPYRSRLIVTPDFLRFDEGKDVGDFLLYDRKKKTIYNTNMQDQTVLVIHNRKVALPEKKDWTHKVDTDNEKMPNVGGKAVKHWVLLTDNLVCYDLYAARGLLPEVTSALAEYRRVLATQQAELYLDTKTENWDVCDLANNVYRPDRYLQHGFPIRYRDKAGRSEQLVDYKQAVSINPDIFKLPAGYREYSISEMRQ